MTKTSEPKILLNSTKANLIIQRFALQIIENHKDISNTAIIGLQPRGIELAKAIYQHIRNLGHHNLLFGEIDHTFSEMISLVEDFICQSLQTLIFQLKIKILLL